MILTVDCETVPQARYVDPATLSGPSIYKWLKAQVAAGLDTCAIEELVRGGEAVLDATDCAPALHATTCHVVQVSFGWRAPMGNQPTEMHRRLIQTDDYSSEPQDAESRLVADALQLIASAVAKGTRLVSFNGKSFDIPMLRARAAILGLTPPRLPWRRLLYPYSDDQHADLRLVLGADSRYARGTLQAWADSFGIHAEEHGADVWPWVRAGEWAKLRAYGECEARTLVELFDAVEAYL